MLNFFIFLVLIFSCGTMYIYFNNKFHNQHKKLMLLKHENINLKNKVNKSTFYSPDQIMIKFFFPKSNKGTILNKCPLYLSPLSQSPILRHIEENTYVEIHDGAEIQGNIWYEVSLSSNDKINTKGWIESTKVNLISSILL